MQAQVVAMDGNPVHDEGSWRQEKGRQPKLPALDDPMGWLELRRD